MTLSLVGAQQGQVLVEPQTVTLAPKGFLAGTVSQIFKSNLMVQSGVVIVQVTAGDGVVGFELVRFPDAQTVVGLNAITTGGYNQSFSAQVAILPQYFTDLKLINTSTVARTATLHLIGDNGTEVVPPANIGLEVGQSFEQDLGQIFGITNAVGSLRVDANGPGLIGDVIFGDPAALRYAACIQLDSQQFTDAVFSQVANGDNFWTGLAIHNPNSQAASVTLDVYSKSGAKTGTRTINMLRGERFSRVLAEAAMVPSTAGQMGGFILVHSTLPIVGQELFGDVHGRFLSAVPPGVIH
jgi:hypothetical protein